MISHPSFELHSWTVTETALNLDVVAHVESVFALSNGHIGIRANLDEGDPHALLGTYLNGFFEVRPLPYAEAAYGNPEAGQTVISVTNGKIIRLVVNDETFDLRYGNLISTARTLDLRAGTAAGGRVGVPRRRRNKSGRPGSSRSSSARSSPSATRSRCRTSRPAWSSSRSWSPTSPPGVASHDPRAAAALEAPLVSLAHIQSELAGCSRPPDRASVAAGGGGMDHQIDGPEGTLIRNESERRHGTAQGRHRRSRPARSCPDQVPRLRMVEPRGRSRAPGAIRAPCSRPLHDGWDEMLRQQRDYLDSFWKHADIEIEGDPELQNAARFALFHVLQAGGAPSGRAIPAKGLTGPGYDGHTFWDTETFVLPVLTYTAPRPPGMRCAGGTGRLIGPRRGPGSWASGAAFPWRTIRGRGVLRLLAGGNRRPSTSTRTSPTPACVTPTRPRTRSSRREYGLEILVETARLWRSLGHHDRARGLPDRRRHRTRRVLGDLRQQRLHQPDGAAEPAGRGRSRGEALRPGGRDGRRLRRDSQLARCGTGHGGALRRGTRGPLPGGAVHAAPALGLSEHAGRQVPAATQLPVFRPLPQAGGKAARPGARAAPLWRPLHPRAEAPRLRLLRDADGPGLLPVGGHPGGGCRRGWPCRAGVTTTSARLR